MFWHSKRRLCKKTREMRNCLPLINNSVAIGLSFLILSISAIISSKMMNSLFFYLVYPYQYFYKYQSFESFKYLKPVLSRLLINN